MRRIRVLIHVSVAIIVAGCASTASTVPSPTADPVPLDGTSWVAVSINDANTVLTAIPTVVFEGRTGG